MVMLASDTPVTTVEQLLALPADGMRHELLRGEHVVTPSPRLIHQEVAGELYGLFWSHVRKRDDLKVLFAPADVQFDEQTLVQPDVFVVKFDPANPPRELNELETPRLIIEVLSPGTASRDRGKKRTIYQEEGVSEYWIVDVDSRIVERWRPEDERPEILRKTIDWKLDDDSDALVIDLVALWHGGPAARD